MPLGPLRGPSNPTQSAEATWGPEVTAPWQVGRKTAAPRAETPAQTPRLSPRDRCCPGTGDAGLRQEEVGAPGSPAPAPGRSRRVWAQRGLAASQSRGVTGLGGQGRGFQAERAACVAGKARGLESWAPSVEREAALPSAQPGPRRTVGWDLPPHSPPPHTQGPLPSQPQSLFISFPAITMGPAQPPGTHRPAALPPVAAMLPWPRPPPGGEDASLLVTRHLTL